MADEWALDKSHTNRLLDAAALVAAGLVAAGALTLCWKVGWGAPGRSFHKISKYHRYL